jgi:N-carbamoylputrescine amidase
MKKQKKTGYVIGLTQITCSKDVNDNLKNAVHWVEKAAKLGAEIICLPELFRSQYFCQKEDFNSFNLAEGIDGESVKTFQAVAKKNKVSIIVPFFERRAAGVYYNSAAVINTDGSLLGVYRKMHIPDDPSYYEKYYFTPGDLGFKSFQTKYGKIGTLICWDQWYPEGARITSLKGATTLFFPTAIGWHPAEKIKYGERQRDSWITIQRSHAIANGVYTASVNRAGLEKPGDNIDGIEFWGSSFICDPQGVILNQASVDKEEIILAEINLEHLETIRRNWPFLRDRRIDAYSEINNRYMD